MTIAAQNYVEDHVELSTGKLRVLRGGTGDPLLVLHHDIGNPGWTPFYDRLAQRFSVHVPDLPGFGFSDRPEFARHPRDFAIILHQFLHKTDMGQVTLVGLGFGGWIAAEMATMCQDRFNRLVLVSPMGIQPEPGKGEILDQMMVSHEAYTEAGFRDRASYEAFFGADASPEHRGAWDFNREMVARVAWKPYMFSHQLPPLLRDVETPALVIWGEQNKVVPRNCAEQYVQWLPNARLETIKDAGHFVDLERPNELADLVAKHKG